MARHPLTTVSASGDARLANWPANPRRTTHGRPPGPRTPRQTTHGSPTGSPSAALGRGRPAALFQPATTKDGTDELVVTRLKTARGRQPRTHHTV